MGDGYSPAYEPRLRIRPFFLEEGVRSQHSARRPSETLASPGQHHWEYRLGDLEGSMDVYFQDVIDLLRVRIREIDGHFMRLAHVIHYAVGRSDPVEQGTSFPRTEYSNVHSIEVRGKACVGSIVAFREVDGMDFRLHLVLAF